MAVTRPDPIACNECGARTLRRHCSSPACHWVICLKCHAVTGVITAGGKLRKASFRPAG